MGRRIYLNNDWYFNESFSEEMLQSGYDFKKNECVRIPHTVKETPLHYFDEHEYQKIAAYFRVLSVPEEWRDKDVFLTFDGVLHSCVVFVNGKEVTTHLCGYTAFTINLSGLVNYGTDNIITVKADSREDQNLPPFGFVIDYMTYGGIYRDVYVDVKEKAHFNDIFVSGDAEGNIRVEISASKDANGMIVENSIISLKKNEDGILVSGEEKSLGEGEFYPDEGKEECVKTYKFDSPALWDTVHPNLYILRSVLKDAAGKIVDENKVRFGFRSA
ncbi:MAG: glycoside hydrolase family 2 protein, partial [Lachnospiraceae bacterium]|nr:glycoside hydrolase family 2 protein [Lachnospiraceae bacterium]